MDKNEMIWERMRSYLPEDLKDFVLDTFSDCFSYSIPRPWDHVVAELLIIMEKRSRLVEKEFKVRQVKNKFGGLRFYVDITDGDDYVYGAIAMAEVECFKICPHCGSYNKTRLRTGRYNTKCTECE